MINIFDAICDHLKAEIVHYYPDGGVLCRMVHDNTLSIKFKDGLLLFNVQDYMGHRVCCKSFVLENRDSLDNIKDWHNDVIKRLSNAKKFT